MATFIEQFMKIAPEGSMGNGFVGKMLPKLLPHMAKDVREMQGESMVGALMFMRRLTSRVLQPIPGIDTLEGQMSAEDDELPLAINE